MRLAFEETKKLYKREKIWIIVSVLLLINVYYIYTTERSLGRQSAELKTIYSRLEGLELDQVIPEFEKFNDNSLFSNAIIQEINEQLERSYSYEEKIDTLVKESKDNLNQQAMGITHKISENLINRYENRVINLFKYPKGITLFLEDNFSGLLMMIVVAFAASGIYTSEKESGLNRIQKSTVGNSKLSYMKSLALLV